MKDRMNKCVKLQSCLLTLLLALSCASHAAAETRICLNMIAKNEADGIMECLEPLAGELAGWTLCDTGNPPICPPAACLQLHIPTSAPQPTLGPSAQPPLEHNTGKAQFKTHRGWQ